VARVDTEWDFVVLKLTEDFLQQYTSLHKRSRSKPELDLIVARGQGVEQQYVTKVKLDWVDPEQGFGVADILKSWQIQGVQTGDRVIY